ncbi:MAG: hypothetical protein QOD26_3997 [Betaproteobacteria bacterium]|nr:hypothetical protein [Betaproteobacteria bacterium]
MPHQRPESDSFSLVHGWRCPLCNSTAYSRIRVQRANNQEYLTEFFECAGCTVIFRHPGRYARLGMPIRRWAADIEPRTLRDVHGFVKQLEPEHKGGAREAQ